MGKPNGVYTMAEYLEKKAAGAKQVDESDVEDKAVKRAATKGRGRKPAAEESGE